MKPSLSVFTIFALVISSQFSSSALAADPGLIVVNESASSPSHTTAMKNSAVWLHWNYTYGGDTFVITYKEQIIGCNSSSQPFQPLAKRTGANGALTVVSPLPSEFSGRIEMISSNSTLVIKNLQLNDSTFSFSSNVVFIIMSRLENIYYLKPSVRIRVQGVPEFAVSPPISIEVNEGASLKITVEMNGNPQPSVDFSWPHLGLAPTNMPSKKIYPYVFSSTYNSPRLGASFCGTNLMTLAKNVAGASPPRSTNVTVLYHNASLLMNSARHLKSGERSSSPISVVNGVINHSLRSVVQSSSPVSTVSGVIQGQMQAVALVARKTFSF